MKLALLTSLFASVYASEYKISIGRLHEVAEIVNSATDSTWRAAVPHEIWSHREDIRLNNLSGEREFAQSSGLRDQDKANYCENNGLPEFFDARQHWPKCASVIGHVYDQGNCGSCWAAAVVSAFTDRVCIASGGNITSMFSIQQVLSCCHKRKDIKNGNGCDGGSSIEAWAYIKKNGLSTGGDYGSKQGCQPYLHRNCDHHLDNPIYPACTIPREKAPKCKLHCYNTAHGKTFKHDRIKVDKYYSISPCAAMNEIYKYGPIVTSMRVYEDFYTYKSGIYQYTTGKKLGGHVIRVIGWGEENGVPYWLVANSWNKHWGENGLFRIKRGTNEAWFEDVFNAGRPKL